ncbi:MAG: polysaccharide biosynthesis tyrosine autokinase [Clostridiales bacterium]|nr:polysaccharide biosynthesis tyrosine autokinase [Clostridiales bacterium]
MEQKTEKNRIEESFSSAFLVRFTGVVFKKLWILAAVALIFATCFYLVTKVLYVEEYRSKTVIAVTQTTYITGFDKDGNEIKVVSKQNIYDENDANKYQMLLKSDHITGKISKALVGQYTRQEIAQSLLLTKAQTSGIFTVVVANENDHFCKEAINVIKVEFPEYLKSFDPSLGVVVINDPQKPVISNKYESAKMGLLGFFIGALLVVLILYISEVVRDTIKTAEDVRYRLNIKVLGTMPTIEHYRRLFSNKKLMRCPILTNENKVSFSFIESFKAIRTKIENSVDGSGNKVFAVTSTFENEGKTTVAVNLASVLSQKGKSVLIIDCDLRKPSVMRMVGIREDGKNGVIQVVKKEAACADSIKYVKPLGFFVLPSGGTTNKSTEIVGAAEFKGMLERVRKEFDYVILDTPPAHVVSDCLVLAPLVDSLIFTIRADYARTKDIILTIEELETTNVDIVGSVLTMVDEKDSNSYFSGWGGSDYYRRRKGYYSGYYKAETRGLSESEKMETGHE